MKGYLQFVENFIRRNVFQRKIDKRYFFLLLTYIGGFTLLFSGTIQAASPLGTWTLGDPETVGNGTQYTFTIDCPGLEVKGGTLFIQVPDGHADTDRLPTVILHDGGGGTSYFTDGFPSRYTKEGFRSVALAWDKDGDGVFGQGWPHNHFGKGAEIAACRPATLFTMVYEEFHAADPDLTGTEEGFCLQGHSGGTAAVGFALTHYGLESIVDFVLTSAGPVMGRVDEGCNPDNAEATITYDNCDTDGDGIGDEDYTSIVPYGGGASLINSWFDTYDVSTTSCTDDRDCEKPSFCYEGNDGSAPGLCAIGYCQHPDGNEAIPPSVYTKFFNNSLAVGGDYDYGDSTLWHFYFCRGTKNNANGMGIYVANKINPPNRKVTCPGGDPEDELTYCTGEKPWRGEGNQTLQIIYDQIVDSMVQDCIPRHAPSCVDDCTCVFRQGSHFWACEQGRRNACHAQACTP